MNVKQNKIYYDFIYVSYILTKRQSNYRKDKIKGIPFFEYTLNIYRQMQPLTVSLAVAFRT